MRISDWSSDVCSSDLVGKPVAVPFLIADSLGRVPVHIAGHFSANLLVDRAAEGEADRDRQRGIFGRDAARDITVEDLIERGPQALRRGRVPFGAVEVARLDREEMDAPHPLRSEEHTSELPSLMRPSN